MSEKLRTRRRVRATTSAALAAVVLSSGLAACSVFADKGPKPALERCFDKPQPETGPPIRTATDISTTDYENEVRKWYKKHGVKKEQLALDPIKLHYQESGNHVTEIPYMAEDIRQKLKEGNVRVDNTAANAHGSGFVAKGNVVVTAAHAVATNDLKNLTVSDSTGEKVSVIGGCYMYEQNGDFSDLLKKENVQHVDVAILRLAKPIGKSVLNLAPSLPDRGTHVTLVNSQGQRTPKAPAEISGIVTTRDPHSLGNTVLTGLEVNQDADGTNASAPGSSGGLIADTMTGDVVGLSYAVLTDKSHLSAETTKEMFNVTFDAPIGAGTGILPVNTQVIGAETINQALTSDVY